LVYFYSRDYDQALRELRRTLEMDANFAQAHIYVGHARVQKEMYEEAIAAYHRAITVAGARPPTYLGFLAHAYARAGHKAEAEKLLKELLARQPTPSAC
jgi:cytochrome c-type biogenesis protein CcmH/NrfG